MDLSQRIPISSVYFLGINQLEQALPRDPLFTLDLKLSLSLYMVNYKYLIYVLKL